MHVVRVAILVTLLGCGTQGPSPSTYDAAPAGALASIPIGRAPTLLAMSPDGSRAYVTSMGRLTTIDTRTNGVVATAAIDPYATGLTPTPDGRALLFTTVGSSSLRLLTAATGAAGASISLPTNLRPGGYGRSAVSPDGTTAWVVNEEEWLAVVDLGAGTARQRPLDLRPHDVAVSHDGETIYLAGCRLYCTSGTVEALDTRRYDTQRTFSVGAAPFRIALAGDGSRLYTTGGGDPILSVVDLATGALEASVPVGAQPTGLAVAPDGAFVYVASFATGALTVVRTADFTVARTVQSSGSARDVATSPDGRRVYVATTAPNTVVAYDAAQLTKP